MKLHTAPIASFLLALLPLTHSATAQDLAITMVADHKAVKIGENITFFITVKNLGPGTATGIVFGNQVQAPLELVSFSCPSGTRVYPTFCNVASLASGASQTVTLVATLKNPAKGQKQFVSTSSIVECQTIDPNINNNTASVKVGVR